MPSIKVTATYYVNNVSDPMEAESMVELGQVDADRIESEPASQSPKNWVAVAIASKFTEKQRQAFFDNSLASNYSEERKKLKEDIHNWLDNILEEVMESNESNWS